MVPQHLQLAGGMCVAAWRVLGGVNTAGSAETAAMLLTGGFVEMAWTGVDGVVLSRSTVPPSTLSCPTVGAGAGAGHDYVTCVHLSCTQVPAPVSDVCDDAKDGTDM